MATYKIKGIILKRYNINEADRLLTIFTDKKGKIRAIAKGVRKPLSKLGSYLEPLYLVDLVMAEGKNLDTITAVEVSEYFPSLREQLIVMGRACRFAELVDSLTEDREEHQVLFGLLAKSLAYLDRQTDNQIIDAFFIVNALALLGYRPELYVCAKCHQAIQPETIGWSCEQGGVVCERCQLPAGDYKISAATVKLLRLILEHDMAILKRLAVEPSLISELDRVLADFVSHYNQRQLASDNFLSMIKGVSNVTMGGN